jgi:hypothetical protein
MPDILSWEGAEGRQGLNMGNIFKCFREIRLEFD